MLKLTLTLCAALFLVMLIGGEDRGQTRPGLAGGIQQAESAAPVAAPQTETAAAEIVVAAPAAPAAPAVQDQAPAAIPVVVEAQPAAAPPVEGATNPVFSLANFSEDAAITPPTAPSPAADGADGAIALVDARSVNVRSGPGTDFDVLSRLTRGEAVTVIGDAGNGWSLIRMEGDGLEGYVSAEYLARQ
jgi:uncharacterized protein YgiM (DUF1202 family)